MLSAKKGKKIWWYMYTCPMHPQILKPQPGICPICGMGLEPKIPTRDEENPELKNMTRRFWVALLLTCPIVLLGVLEMFQVKALSFDSRWVEGILATPVVLWAGSPFFARAGISIVRRKLNMFTLIAMGIGAAYFYSVIALLFPSLFPPSFRAQNHQIALYFEPSVVITVLVLLGQVLELKARAKTGLAIRALLDLSPKMATLILENKEEREVALEEIKKGDMLRVRPGQKVPVDGVILEGKSAIDESMMTGESVPVKKGANDKLIGATLNGTGSFIMRAEKVGSETLLARMVQMVSAAQSSKAPIQKLADTVAGYFVPVVIFIALITFFVWSMIGPPPAFAHGLINAVAVLIIACPCALGLATPLSVMVGVGKGATAGILIKNAEALEKMAKVDTVIVDKTGTLTEGKISLNHVYCLDEQNNDLVLQWSASLESLSEHPLSLAVITKAKEKKLPLLQVEDFQSVPGKGITGGIECKHVAIGNLKLMADLKILVEQFAKVAEDFLKQGQTLLYFAKEGKAVGLLAVSDVIKASTPDAIQSLHRAGVRVVMLTGDHQSTAEAIGTLLRIDEIIADMLPQDKSAIVKKLQSQGHIVAMAGDGVNDAPALARADVGIAMGTGTDVAIESAGITLVKGDLRGIARSRNLSLAVTRNIRQNLLFAFIYNALGVPIAAGVLYPVFGLLLSPVFASAAMAFSSVSVVWNALRLNRQKI